MTLKQVITELCKIALTQHNVRSAGYNDLYAFMDANPSVKYDVWFVTQNQHQSEGEFDRYGLNLFYISRLEDVDGNNALQIQSIGKEVIENVVEIFCQKYDAEVFGITYYQPFTQKFSDLTAGVYAIIVLEVPKDSVCIDD